MKIEEILYEMEGKCHMNISAPAGVDELFHLESMFPEHAKHLKRLYAVTDGVEINVPGTVIYSAGMVMKRNYGKDTKDPLEIGTMNFGDRLLMAVDGVIIQIDHETEEVFLEWGTINQFLMDELSAL